MLINNIKKPIGLFFYDKTIFYITYEQKTTRIFSKDVYEIHHHVTYVCNELFIPYLKTFEGYKHAYQKLFHQHVLIPIVLNPSHIFIPMYGYRSKSNILLNILEIYGMIEDHFGCIIHFLNGQSIFVNKTCQSIKKQMNKALFNHNVIK